MSTVNTNVEARREELKLEIVWNTNAVEHLSRQMDTAKGPEWFTLREMYQVACGRMDAAQKELQEIGYR